MTLEELGGQANALFKADPMLLDERVAVAHELARRLGVAKTAMITAVAYLAKENTQEVHNALMTALEGIGAL